jgi:hypothetical protein
MNGLKVSFGGEPICDRIGGIGLTQDQPPALQGWGKAAYSGNNS